MALTCEEILDILKKLKPTGRAWLDEPQLTQNKLLEASSDEFCRADVRTDELIVELDPQTTTEMIEDWERTAGLPDKCFDGLALTLQERRDAVVSKLRRRGGQSVPFFFDLGESNNLTINNIDEFFPFRAGRNSTGDNLYDENWWYYWQVNSPFVNGVGFTAGADGETTAEFVEGKPRTKNGRAGDPLRDWGDPFLECLYQTYKPAHTIVRFGYQ